MATGERIPTPVDERGIADHDSLISLALQLAYEKGIALSETEDVHHEYWGMRAVVGREHDSNIARRYRELPINKILLPRSLHDLVIHRFTYPPELPSNQVMEYRITAWEVAHSLFKGARSVRVRERLVTKWSNARRSGLLGPNTDDSIGWEWLESERQDRDFECMMLEQIRSTIPPQYLLEEDFTDLNGALESITSLNGHSSEKNRKGFLNLELLGVELVAA